ncbi:hypothetical protein HK103_002640 [Boothiomyces macroporosus]|uniref:Cytochrome P450 n=1 Tax=Boothiomyces macroporosus TaxID=261099 RepID=A0AAD5YB69_9FUNG|nr:hypothetical protein HK103_002640 [Boothiomyces macroporosus]
MPDNKFLYWAGIASVPLLALVISNEYKARRVTNRKPITSFSAHPEAVPIPTSTLFEILMWIPNIFSIENPTNSVKEKGLVSRWSLLGLPMIDLGGAEALDFLSACERQKLLAQNWPSSTVDYLGNVAAVKDGAENTFHRNLISGPFKQPLLGSYVPQIEEITRVIVSRELETSVMDTVDVAKRITISVMLGCIFGIKNITSADLQAELSEWRLHFQNYQDGLFSVPIDLPFTAFHRGKQSKEWLKQKSILLMKEQVIEWENSGRNPAFETFFVQLYNSKDEFGNPLDESTIGDQAMLMLFAGHDTSASVIISLVSFLHDHPDALERVSQESYDIFGKEPQRTMQYSDLNKLTYLDAAIKETLRIRTPVLRVLKKTLTDLTFDGYHIPANSSLSFNIAGSGYYYGADKAPVDQFYPERYLDTQHLEDNQLGFTPTLQPFGFGKHSCIGKPLALMELKTVISTFVRLVNFKKVKPHTEFTHFPIAYPKGEMLLDISSK